MAYLFRQKLRMEDLVDVPQQRYKILIYEPQQDLSGLYLHYLSQHNFDIKHCPNLEEVKSALVEFSPQVFIFSTDAAPRSLLKMVKALRPEFPQLLLISLGLGGDEQIRELMDLGIVSHINRKLSRPEDLVTIVKSILN